MTAQVMELVQPRRAQPVNLEDCRVKQRTSQDLGGQELFGTAKATASGRQVQHEHWACNWVLISRHEEWREDLRRHSCIAIFADTPYDGIKMLNEEDSDFQ